jgi:hypothetical protein
VTLPATPGPSVPTAFTSYKGFEYTFEYGDTLPRTNDAGQNASDHELLALYSRTGPIWYYFANFGMLGNESAPWISLRMGYDFGTQTAPVTITYLGTFKSCTYKVNGNYVGEIDRCNVFMATAGTYFEFPGTVDNADEFSKGNGLLPSFVPSIATPMP